MKDHQMLQWAHEGARIFSTCSRRQFMAIITDPHGRVVGTGYNGSPPGAAHCKDGACPHARDPHGLSSADRGNCIAIHAEANALMYSDHSERSGGTLYVNGVPCINCARLIAGSGVTRVVCGDDGVGGGLELLHQSFIPVTLFSLT